MKQLILERPLDGDLSPIKDSDGTSSSLLISENKIQVKDIEVTGTQIGTSDDKLPLSGGTMSGALNMDDGDIDSVGGLDIISGNNGLRFDGGNEIQGYIVSDTLTGHATTNIASTRSIKNYVDAGDEKGWHGSATRVKILHSDFIADDGGRPVQIDDSGSDRWIESDRSNPMFASVPIPTGYTATHINIYGSATSAITVYEADINSKTVTSKGTGNIGTEIDITDVASDTTNYILIQMAQANGEEVYGGYMTIAAS